MSALAIGYLLMCSFLNVAIARLGHVNITHGDKDIFLPFSAMLFLFFPLLIYLPQAHYKIVTSGQSNITSSQADEEEEEGFPLAFLITLICFTIATVIHQLVSKPRAEEPQQGMHRNIECRKQTQILKTYLSIGIGLQNMVQAYYIALETEQKIVFNEFLIYCIFSLLINFAYGYICGWSGLSSDLHRKLTIFINVGILLGYVIGLFVESNPLMATLPCLSSGLLIYSCMVVCYPLIFSNGENPTQDKFRYGSIFTALLLSVVYHPFCYLLRL